MAEIVNLRRSRKQKARAKKETQAAENRRRFGRTKAEREMAEAENVNAARRLEGHQLGGNPPKRPQ